MTEDEARALPEWATLQWTVRSYQPVTLPGVPNQVAAGKNGHGHLIAVIECVGGGYLYRCVSISTHHHLPHVTMESAQAACQEAYSEHVLRAVLLQTEQCLRHMP